MSDSDEDLDALFDQIASQSASTIKTAANQNSTDITTDSSSEKPIFERLGSVVRVLHDSMRELGYDRSLSDATSQINDAHGRLEYIATLTEEAANKVLNTIDEGIPAQDELAKAAKQMQERWDQLFAGQLNVEAFKTLANDSRAFAQNTLSSTEAEKARLLSIMMSQDFQDLTGQLIKKVVAITSSVERELAQILIDNAPATAKEKSTDGFLNGPSLPTSAMNQDDVDNLLGSLGF